MRELGKPLPFAASDRLCLVRPLWPTYLTDDLPD